MTTVIPRLLLAVPAAGGLFLAGCAASSLGIAVSSTTSSQAVASAEAVRGVSYEVFLVGLDKRAVPLPDGASVATDDGEA